MSDLLKTLSYILTSRILDVENAKAEAAEKRERLSKYVQAMEDSPAKETLRKHHKELFKPQK